MSDTLNGVTCPFSLEAQAGVSNQQDNKFFHLAMAVIAIDAVQDTTDQIVDSRMQSSSPCQSNSSPYDQYSTWKNFLEQLKELLTLGNYSAADIAKILELLSTVMQHFGDCPSDLKSDMETVINSLLGYLLGNPPSAQNLINLVISLYDTMSTQGISNIPQKIQQFLDTLLHSVEEYYTNSGQTDKANTLSEELSSLETAAMTALNNYIADPSPSEEKTAEEWVEAFFDFSTGFYATEEKVLTQAFTKSIEHESLWERCFDVLDMWGYLSQAGQMNAFNQMSKYINQIQQAINNIHNDVNQIANNPSDTAAAQDLAKQMQFLQDLLQSPEAQMFLGKPGSDGQYPSGSAGAALEQFLSVMNSLDNGNLGKAIDTLNNPDSTPQQKKNAEAYIDTLVSQLFSNTTPTPSPEEEAFSTGITNAESSFSTLSQTTGMKMQNAATNADTMIKVMNSILQTFTNLIRPTTTYSGV